MPAIEPTKSNRPYNSLYVRLLKDVLRNRFYYEDTSPTRSDIESCEAQLIRIRNEKPALQHEFSNLTGNALAVFFHTASNTRKVHTFVGPAALDNIESCVGSVISDDIPGDLVDAGVLRGGTSVLMRATLAAWDDRTRLVWVADSFEGLPAPTKLDSIFSREVWYALAEQLPQFNLLCVASESEVRNTFSLYELLDEQVRFLPGWFSETLPLAPIEAIALLRIDVDWFQSTMDVLENLYSKVSHGGFVIIDDYKLGGCRRAVDLFRVRNGIFSKVQTADAEAGVVFWRKE